MEVLCKLTSIFGLFKDAPEAIPQQLTSETGCFQIQSFDWIGNLWWQIRMQFFRNPHPEIPMPFSFFTITLHFCTSDMVEGLFPQMWAIYGIFVEQTQLYHHFSARWKNCCKRGNLSTKRPSLQTVEQVNGTGRWIALRGTTPPSRSVLRTVEPDGSTPRCFASFSAAQWSPNQWK